MRTQEEILARIKSTEDFFGFEVDEYIPHLDFQHAKEFLKGDVTEEKWVSAIKDQLPPKEQIIDYMPFAWEKANNFRGISAGRSIAHMRAWLWLDNQDQFLADNNNLDDYEHYGKDLLVKICELYGLDAKQWDDGVRLNEEPDY